MSKPMGFLGMGKVIDEIVKAPEKGRSISHLFNVPGSSYIKPEDLKETCTRENPCSFCQKKAQENKAPIGGWVE
jgi:hypothetical protein